MSAARLLCRSLMAVLATLVLALGLGCGSQSQFCQDAQSEEIPAATYPYELTQVGATLTVAPSVTLHGPITAATVTSGTLPPGMSLLPDGDVTGSPTTEGVYSFTVLLANGFGGTVSAPEVISVIPKGALGVAYANPITFPLQIPIATQTPQVLNALVAPPGFTLAFAVTPGTLPPGLALDPGTGNITGTPTQPGNFTFTVTLTNGARTAFTQVNYIVLTPGPLTLGYASIVYPAGTAIPDQLPTLGNAISGLATTYTAIAANCTALLPVPLTNDLPTGLAIDPASGTISGTPQDPGVYNLTVSVTDSYRTTPTSFQYVFTPAAALTLAYATPEVFPAGTTITSQLSVLGNPTPGVATTYAVTTGSLPAGLGIDPSAGTISGNPTTPGVSSFTVTATNGTRSAAANLNYTVTFAAPLGLSYATPLTFPTGSPIATQSPLLADATPGVPVGYAVTSGSLPPGLGIDPFLGNITGIPTTPGVYPFTVTVTNGTLSAQVALTYTVSLTLSYPTPQTFSTGTLIATQSPTSNTTGNTYAVTTGSLPPGLAITASGGGAGSITGTPTTPGVYPFTITATNTANGTVTATANVTYTVSLTLGYATPLTFPTGSQIATQSPATNGTGSTYAVTVGSLPPGLAIAANGGSAGNITGTPTTPGVYTFTVTATNTAHGTVTVTASATYTVSLTLNYTNQTFPTGAPIATQSPATNAAGNTYAVTAGSLPPGLAITASGAGAGNITGTPTTPGVYPFTVTATNAANGTVTAAANVTYTVSLTLSYATPLTFPTGTPIATQSPTSNTTGNTYAVTTGSLPPGLAVIAGPGAGAGNITGTPTTPGVYAFAVTATNTANGTVTAAANVTYTVSLTLSYATPLTFPTGTPIATQSPTSNTTGNTYAVTVGSLPPGLAIAANGGSAGNITGTPTTPGVYAFTVTATDTANGTVTAAANVTYTVSLTLSYATPLTFPIGSQITTQSPTSNAAGNTYAVTVGSLPPGLAIAANGGSAGNITGTPTTPGVYTFTVTATDAAHGTVTATASLTYTVSLTLSYATPMTFPTGSLIATQSPTTNGGSSNTYAVTTGSLPPGLTIAAGTGQITGTPTTPGVYPFTVTATNAANGTVTAAANVTYTVSLTLSYATPLTFPTGTPIATQSPTSNTTGNTYAVTTGSLPPGLAVIAGPGAGAGNITGTPTTPGVYAFAVTATNTANGTVTAAANVTYTVSLTLSYATPLTFPTGTPIATQSPTSNTTGNTYAVTVGSLPPGLAIAANGGSAGNITGTPTTPGVYAFTVTATDTANGTVTAAANVTYTVSLTLSYATPLTFPIGSQITTQSPTSNAAGNTYAVTVGSLPPGLAIAANGGSAGNITGTPTTPGVYTFTVTATDAAHGTVTATASLTYTVSLTLSYATPMTFPTGSLIATQSPTTNGGSSNTYAVTTGSLPPGLTIAAGTGQITGTPNTPGVYPFTVTATNAAHGTVTAAANVTYTVSLTLGYSNQTFPNGTPIATQNPTTNGGSNNTYAVTTGSLPPGLAIAAGTGQITGTPTTPGVYPFTVTATDSANGTVTAPANVTYTVSLTLTYVTPQVFTVGTPIATQAPTINYVGATFTSPSGLPSWLSMDGSGNLTGTPTISGKYTFTVKAATNGVSVTTGTITYYVNPIGALGLTYPTPTWYTTNTSVGSTLTPAPTNATPGATLTYSLQTGSGTLPPGLTLSSGNITGTVTTVGAYTFTVNLVETPVGRSTSFTMTVNVVAPPVITNFVATAPLISQGGSTSLQATYTNGTGGTAMIGTTGTGSSNLTGTAANGNTPIPTPALLTTTTYTLTVTNGASGTGSSTTATCIVTVVQGSSTPTVSLAGPLYDHTSTLLPDGTVLVAGGRSGITAPLNTAQVFNATGTSVGSVLTMNSARYGHTATVLANDTVLVAGGHDTTTLQACEIYNVGAGTFTPIGNMKSPRENHTATLLPNGKVLLVGGLDNGAPVVTAELYDPSSQTFTYTAGNLNTARYDHTATLLANGQVLIAGGSNGSISLASAELFNPATGAFTVVGSSMTAARQRHAAALLSDGTVGLFGGFGAAPLASAETFNPSTNTFTATAGAMTHARDGLTATLMGAGEVIVAGGVDATGSPVQDCEMYNYTPRTFALSGLLATARTQHTATILRDGQALIVGGLVSATATASAELINPQDGTTPVLPNATITTPVGAQESATGLNATLPNPAAQNATVQYVWMLTGGTVTAGSGTDALTFNMPASGTATLDALVTTDRQIPVHQQWVVTPLPVITSFAPSQLKATVNLTEASLAWTVTDSTTTSSLVVTDALNNVLFSNAAALTGSVPVTLTAVGPASYTLTVANAGGSVSATTSITGVAAPSATSLTPSPATVAVGGTSTLTPVFTTDPTYGTSASIIRTLDSAVVASGVASGTAYPTPAITANPTGFTLVVTNAAGDSNTSQTASVALDPVTVVVSGPVYVTAGSPVTNSGVPASYSAAVTGAVNTGVTWSTDSGSPTGSTSTTTGFTTTSTGTVHLTGTAVEHATGVPAATNALPVTVVAPATGTLACNGSSTSPVMLDYGTALSLVPTFAGGTGQIVGFGSVTSGQTVAGGALTANQTFTLNVTNQANDVHTATVTVNLNPVSVTTPVATASATTFTAGQTTQFTATTVHSTNTSVNWTSSDGGINATTGAWTAPLSGSYPTTYTITAHSVSPSSYASTPLSVTVVAPPTAALTASATTVGSGTPFTLTATFSGNTGGSVTVSPATSAGTFAPGTSPATTASLTVTATTTYTLTVTNSLGASATSSVTINYVSGTSTTSGSSLSQERGGNTVTLLADGTILVAGGSSSATADLFSGAGVLNTTIPMKASRIYHTATLLANGKVLLAGGQDGSSGFPLATAELYDPTSQTCTLVGNSMLASRATHTAALLADGRVLISGGYGTNLDAVQQSTDIYDPVANAFSAGPNSAPDAAAEWGTATALNGGVFQAGGFTGTAAVGIGQAFAYTTSSWGSDITLQTARAQHTATLLPGGNVLLAGGTQNPGSGIGLSSAEVYSGGSPTTADGNLMNEARCGHTANVLVSGLVLLAGGSSFGGTFSTNSAELYDPSTGVFWIDTPLNAFRYLAGSTITRSGPVFFAGGFTRGRPASAPTNSVELYDPMGPTPVTPYNGTVTVTAPASATSGTSGLLASVPALENVTYVWTLSGGTITAGLGTNQVTFTMGASGPAVLDVLVISDRQIPVIGTATVAAAPPKVISFSFAPSGTSTATVSWTVTGSASGSGLGVTVLDAGSNAIGSTVYNTVGGVTTATGSATVTTAGFTSSYTYSLSATDVNGTSPAALATPTIASFSASEPVQLGGSTTVLPVFAGGSGSIAGLGVVQSGFGYTTGALNVHTSSTPFVLTVATSTANTSATVTQTCNVIAGPAVVGTITGPTFVTVNTAAVYSTTVSGVISGYATVTWSASGGGNAWTGGSWTPTVTGGPFTITATAVDGSTNTLTNVYVVAVPVATSLTAAQTTVPYGGTTTLSPTFSQGTGVISSSNGSINAGSSGNGTQQYNSGPITASTLFTLTVTNAAGLAASPSPTVTVGPETVSLSAITGLTPYAGDGNYYITEGHQATFSATVSGAVNTAPTWSSGGAGTWSGTSTWTAPATAGPVTITATAMDNHTTSTLTVVVVPPPVITANSFAATPPGVNNGVAATLTATFTGAGTGANANGVVTPGPLSLSSGGPSVSTGPLTVTTPYTLTVTNNAGDSTTAQTTVQVFLGSFSVPATGLSVPRNTPTATLLSGGNVLVAGGGGTPSTAVDLFNGTSLAFAPGAFPLQAARTGHSATLLPNGKVLLAGGAGPLASAELYNPAAGSFTLTGSLHTARLNQSAVLLDSGLVLVAGGFDGSNPLTSAELFNPLLGTFTAIESMETARQAPTLSRLPDGRILVSGGLGTGSARLSSTEIFDPSSNTFSTGGSMLQPRYQHTATTLPSGGILIAGGTGTQATGSAELFNPTLMRFGATGDMVQPRQAHTATLLGSGMVLMVGGNSGSTTTAISQAELYNPATSTFLNTDFMTTPATGAAVTGGAAAPLQTGQVLSTGGTSDGTTPVTVSELYTSTLAAPLPAANAAITAATYVAQGSTSLTATVAAGSGRYIWMVTNGTLVSGQGSASITYSMPATGNAVLDVLIISGSCVPAHGQATVVGEPPPVITSFTSDAVSGYTLFQGPLNLTGVFSNGTGEIGTGGVGTSNVAASVASGTPFNIPSHTGSTVYTLTVTNLAGIAVSQNLTVNTDSVIVSTPLPSTPSLISGNSVTFSVTVSGAENPNVTWSATGGAGTWSNYTVDGNTISSTWTATTAPGQYTITATSAATGSFATTQATVTPVTLSIVGPQNVNVSTSFTYTATVNGPAGTAVTWSSNPTGYIGTTTGVFNAPATAMSITLTATAVSPGSTPANLQVAVVGAPAIQGFSASAATVNYGQTVTLTPAFTGAAGNVASIGTSGPNSSQLTATAASGAGVVSGPLTATTTFTLTVTNAADTSVNQSVTVTVTQPWSYTGSMALARTGQSTTQLGDGTVLVAGGTGSADLGEIYSGSSFAYTTGAMRAARAGHTATLLGDGTVLLAGGFNGAGAVLGTAEIYNPNTGLFTATTGNLQAARGNHAAVLLPDGQVLLIGGFDGTSPLASAETYDPATGLFTTLGSGLLQAREFATATLLPSGSVLVAGGTGGSGNLATAELYSAGAFGGSTLAMQKARARHTATLLLDGTVLLAGGADISGVPQVSAEVFNPTGGTFTLTTQSLATGRQQHTATLLVSGNVLVAGGSDGTNPLASAQLYVPLTGDFQDTGSLGTARYGAGATLLRSGNALVLGGTGVGPAALASAELFNAQDGLTPVLPSPGLTAPADAPFGSPQGASVTLPAGGSCVWAIGNGTLTSGQGTATVTFTMGASGNTDILVVDFSALGLPALASQLVLGQ